MRRPAAALATTALVCAALAAQASSASALRVTWMAGFHAPGTPARYDRVGVLKIGPADAKNVLVLEPGTSAGSAYFVPLARWLVASVKGWQVWSVERRENLLEDQSLFNRAKDGTAGPTQVFDYYLGWLADPAIKRHVRLIPDSSVGFARGWGMNVAVQDLHRVIEGARKLGGKVVLGGHSLGGSVVTAYATWNFHGRPGADELAGLVYDDGGSFAQAVSAATASTELQTLATGTPWLAFSGVPAPFLGLYETAGAIAALTNPNMRSLGQSFPLLPAVLDGPVPMTNLALFGYDTDVKTSKLVFAAQAHDGHLDTRFSPARWSDRGALTPVKRWAAMLGGFGIQNVDGSEWYFPQRLTDDAGAVANGNANPAQQVLGLRATMGHKLPRRLLIYAFGAYGGQTILDAARQLAAQSKIPARNVTLVNRHGSYAHNDPAAAYPHNAFFSHLIRFLKRAG